MNNKLVKGSLAGVAALALAAGTTTFASWSDFAEVNGNVASAGILRLDLAGGNTDSASLGFDNVRMKPGGKVERVMYIASNDGDSVPDGNLTLKISNLVDSESNGFKADGVTPGTPLSDGSNCTTNSERVAENVADCASNGGEFLRESQIVVRYSDPGVLPAGTNPEACDNALPFPSTKDFRWQFGNDKSTLNNKEFDLGRVGPGTGVCVIVQVQLEKDKATNASQGDSMGFDMRYDLKQAF
jgi:alternate signal-mediated exported protein